ncbi:CHAT domain-containing protein [Kitasatospora sp. NPDC050543]|uniref:CHAT domain-containing protein n=1 Tax=Kitasatospora sp. NPDC050543 TaxID=3364054 RepID=UPI0037BDD41A
MTTNGEGAGEHPLDVTRLYRLMARGGQPPRDRGMALIKLSYELYEAGRSLDTAAQAAAAALPLFRDLPGHQAYVHQQLASLADLRGDLARAQAHAERALMLAELAKDQAGQSLAHRVLGHLAHQRGNLARAQRHAEEALRLGDGSDILRGQALLLLGWLAMQRGDMDQASRLLEDSLQIGTANGDLFQQGNAHYLLGDWALQRGDHELALEHLQQSLELAEANGDLLGQQNAHYMLGQVSHGRSDFRAAHAHANQSLALAEATGNVQGQGRVNYLIGQLAEGEGNLRLAHDHATQALLLAERAEDVEGQGRSLHLLGEIALERGDDAESRRWLLLAAERAETAESLSVQGRIHLLLGVLADRNGDSQEARSHMERAQAVAAALEDPQALGVAHFLIGDLVGTGNAQEARWHCGRGLAFAEASDDLVTQANLHHLLGELALEENPEEAYHFAQRALRLAKGAGSVPTVASAHMLAAKAIMAGPREQWPAALEPALEAIRAREYLRVRLGSAAYRARYLAGTGSWDRLALSLASLRQDGYAGLEIAEIGRGEAISALLHLHTTEKEAPVHVRQVLAELEDVQAAAAAVFDPPPEGLSGMPVPDPAELEDAREKYVRRIKGLYADLATLVGNAFRQAFAPDPVDVHKLRSRLPAHAHALVLSLFHYEGEGPGGRMLATVWVPPDAAMAPQIELHTLERRQVEWLTALTASEGDQGAGQLLLLDPSHPWRTELGERLMPAGLRAYLASIDPDGDEPPPTLFIVPSRELWGLPFAALALGDRFLIDYAALSLLPSLRMIQSSVGIEETVEDDSPSRAIIYLHGIEGADLERRQLIGDYPAGRLDEETDPKELVSKLRNGQKYRLGVLSAHGDGQSGLAHSLWLTSTFPLSAAGLLNLRMPPSVVLGACWAGHLEFAPGEEPIGLPTVALTRGATSIIAALYSVPSYATGALLASCYRNMATGKAASHSLREAQRGYIRTHAPDDQGTPWHWAGLTTLATAP